MATTTAGWLRVPVTAPFVGEELVHDETAWNWLAAVYGPLVLLPFGLLIFVGSVYGLVVLLDRIGVPGPRRAIRALYPSASVRPASPKQKELKSWQLVLSSLFGLVLGLMVMRHGSVLLVNRVLPCTTIHGRIEAVRQSGHGRSHSKWIVVDGVKWGYSSTKPMQVAVGDCVRIELEYFHDGSVARVWRRQ